MLTGDADTDAPGEMFVSVTVSPGLMLAYMPMTRA
jgi:hypothetical protein